MRPHRHQEIGKAFDQDTEISLWTVLPHILELHTVNSADIDLIESARDGVKTGRINDNVEFTLDVARLNPTIGDALDRCFIDVDEFDVGLVVDLVVTCFERHPAGPKPMALGNQLFRHR